MAEGERRKMVSIAQEMAQLGKCRPLILAEAPIKLLHAVVVHNGLFAPLEIV